MSLYPGKGVRVPLNADFATWLLSVHGQVNQAFEYARDRAVARGKTNPESVQDDIFSWLVNTCDWEKESDQYGEKASIGFETSSKDTFYVTVIIALNGKISVDYRNWFTKD